LPEAPRLVHVDRALFWAGVLLLVAYFPLSIFLAPALSTPTTSWGFGILIPIGVALLLGSVFVGSGSRAAREPSAPSSPAPK
jgi:nitric oxide reductase large subunit